MTNSVRLDGKTVVISASGCEFALSRATLSKCDIPSDFNPTTTFPVVFSLGVFVVNGRTYAAFATSVATHAGLWHINTVTGFRVLQLSQESPDASVEALVLQGLELSPLFYSDERDLSLTVANIESGLPSRSKFVWNWKPIEQACKLCDEFKTVVKPVIAGFIGVFEKPKYTFCLISRRCSVRAGTRLWMRGADADGNVANYVESEQIVIGEKATFSYVQVRGSVPLVWTQTPDLSRLPPLALDEETKCEASLNCHFEGMVDEYGPVIAVSLTDHKGREKGITERYNDYGSKAKDVRFQYFDFHTECSKMRWENIDKLIAKIRDGIDKMAYTEVSSGKVITTQVGVLRTNCIDCLDRTNVVQSVAARIVLEKQLEALGVTGFDCDQEFRNVWTDNADAISCQYAGTPALKTDYTRTGKRTVAGALVDGKNAMVRYYVNTCTDGTRQDAYDVVTQAVPCDGYSTGNGLLMTVLMSLYALIMLFILWATQGKQAAKQRVIQIRKKAVNRPHFRKEITKD